MIPAARARRAQVRQLRAEIRAHRRATKAVATGAPQTAKTHLIASGVDTATAARFVGAFSRSVLATATATTTIKLKGRVTKRVAVKLYDVATFRARLAVYRPKAAAAAATFERAALLAA